MSNSNIRQPQEQLHDNLALADLRKQYSDNEVYHGRLIAENLLTQYESDQCAFDTFLDPSCPDPIPSDENLPGFAGVIANTVLMASVIPQPKVAIITTLAILSGVFGRRIRTPSDAYVNGYYVVLGYSGQGKDTIHTVPQKLVGDINPYATRFVRNIKAKSAEALEQELSDLPGGVFLHRELGQRLKGMINGKFDSPDRKYGTMHIELYSAPSIQASILRNKERNIEGQPDPAYSLLGESTPDTYFDALNLQSAEDGFLSRIITVHIGEDCPPRNKRPVVYMEPHLLQHWKRVLELSVGYETQLKESNLTKPIRVNWAGSGAEELFDDFERLCDHKKREALKEKNFVKNAAYTRAALKVMKLASLLAAANDPVNPKITSQDVEWSRNYIEADMQLYLDKVDLGEIGNKDESERITRIITVCQCYLRGKGPIQVTPDKKEPRSLYEQGVISRKTLQLYTRIKAFTDHANQDHSTLLNKAIQNLIDNGTLKEIQKDHAVEKLGFHGRCFRILEID
ncbi:hypothetical protein KVQ64_002071 [Vibrio vulnificus]|nr:hypothetical protein [Vibrio vulnificus]